jgi:hypothetical protein
MAEELKLNLKTSKGWAVQPINDTHTGLVFNMDDGPLGVAIANQEFSRLASRIILEAEKHAATQTPKLEKSETLRSDPIPVISMGFSPGRTNQEAFVAMKLGNLDLVFAVELSILRRLCTDLLPTVSEGPSPTKN